MNRASLPAAITARGRSTSRAEVSQRAAPAASISARDPGPGLGQPAQQVVGAARASGSSSQESSNLRRS